MNQDLSQHTSVPATFRPVRRDDVRIQVLDGEALIFDATTADTHRLNKTACTIWHLCDGDRDLHAIADEISCVYEVDAATALVHIQGFVEVMQEHDLLQT